MGCLILRFDHLYFPQHQLSLIIKAFSITKAFMKLSRLLIGPILIHEHLGLEVINLFYLLLEA